MTLTFFNPRVLFMLALLGIVLAISTGILRPGLGASVGKPESDCGRHYHYVVIGPDRGYDKCLASFPEKTVDELARNIQNEEMGGALKEGEIWAESPIERALEYLLKHLGF